MTRTKSIKKRVKVATGQMTVRIWPLLSRCVESGVAYGWNRAHKHTDKPDRETVKDEIERAVMNEISEWFEITEAEDT